MLHPTVTPRVRVLCSWWAVGLALTLLWDWSGLDVAVMHTLGDSKGFPLRHHGLLTQVFHDGFRTLAICTLVLLWIQALRHNRHQRLIRQDKLVIVTLITANVVAVNLFKHFSLTSCPWDMRLWGGTWEVVGHWAWGVSDGGPGRCFPGGHASAALAFAPWLLARWWPTPGTQRSIRQSRWALALWLLAVVITGGTQTLRGAHYPSHTAWTAILCCGIAVLGWSLWQNHRAKRFTSAP